MTSAEKRALEAYPDFDAGSAKVIQGFQRQCYINGYEQAEKDLALIWEDIAKIDALILEANNEFAVDYSKEISREQFYTEVLNRFNKSKEEV